ncbi:MAG: DUF3800 domain-containing protein [Verrucomicrobiota bacterium]
MFVDESGDTGLKLGQGSSERFVVTLVVFEDVEDAHAAEARIKQLRHELGVKKEFEFHYSRMKPSYHEPFFQALGQEHFFYCSIAINKRKLIGPGFKVKESFYKYACRLVFENVKPLLDNAKIVIDGSGSREFKRELSSYLKKHMNSTDHNFKRIKKVQMEDSRKNDLIQLADMICGAVARKLAGKSNGIKHHRYIRHLELRVQEWPK